jgi:hypothetical protein
MEGGRATGDINNGGRFGGLLFCSGSFEIFVAIRRASSFSSGSAKQCAGSHQMSPICSIGESLVMKTSGDNTRLHWTQGMRHNLVYSILIWAPAELI